MQRGCSIGLSRIAGNRGDTRTALTQGCGPECLISPSPINAPLPRGDETNLDGLILDCLFGRRLQ